MRRVLTRRRIGWVAMAIGAALLGVILWGIVAVLQIRNSASAAAAHLQELSELVTAPGSAADVDRQRTLLEVATDETATAQRWANALPIRLAAILPGTRDDARALRQLTAATGTTVREALPRLLAVSEALERDRLQRPEGGIDTAVLVNAAPDATAAAEAADRAAGQASDIRVESLAGPLREPAARVQRGLEQLREQTHLLSQALVVLPPALGHDGRREYLLAFQNLAEARPTGGVVGAWALLGADGGRVELVETGANDDLQVLTAPVRDLGPEVRQLYGPDVELSQNLNLSPHFPHAATLLSDLWEAQGRDPPDGVIALDPVALQNLLTITGPLDVAEGPSVDAATVVDVLQAHVYADFAGRDDQRRSYLSRVTATVFRAAVQKGIGDPALLRAVAEAAGTGHLLVWSSDASTQQLVERAGLGGVLAEPAADRIGVHLTNVDGSKLDHYLRVGVTCHGRDLLLSFTNQAPADLPAYAANQLADMAPTTHRLVVDVLLPPTRGVQQIWVDGTASAVSVGTLQSWTVARRVVDLPRDSTVEVLWRLANATPRTRVSVQPLTVPATITQCEGS